MSEVAHASNARAADRGGRVDARRIGVLALVALLILIPMIAGNFLLYGLAGVMIGVIVKQSRRLFARAD